MEQHSPTGSRKRTAKFLIGGGVVAAAVVGLVVWAMAQPNATAYYYSVSEMLAADAPAQAEARQVRVNGKVVPGSIETRGGRTRFLISDGKTELGITTTEPVPDTLKDEAEVVALGRVAHEPVVAGGRSRPAVFEATEVLAKCPSKFKARA